jgi:hypothetical protein
MAGVLEVREMRHGIGGRQASFARRARILRGAEFAADNVEFLM